VFLIYEVLEYVYHSACDKKYGKLSDNFSPESDVTSLQDPFTSLPYKTPF